MAIEVFAVGGYGEVGRNMTAIKVGDEVFLLDMGLHMPNYIKYTEEEETEQKVHTAEELRKAKAIPEDTLIQEWRSGVKAIITTHAHLDHIGAIPYLAERYKAPVYCTPFTGEVIKSILKDQNRKIPNPIKTMHPNSSMKITDNVTLEFIGMTHSTPQSVIAVLHTPEGIVAYTNDFKLDNNPILGQKPNYEGMRRLSEKGVKIAIIDTLYADDERKTPSEMIAREMLRDVMLNGNNQGKGMLITTFSSHIARIQSAVEFAKKLGRQPVLIGRSLAKYVEAAENAGIAHFAKDVHIVKYASQARKELNKIIKKGTHKHVLITTGHQGEPRAVLSKMVDGVLPFPFKKEDQVIFSCNVIPTDVNISLRAKLDEKLRARGIRLFKGIHVSGHGGREDMRELIQLLKPKNVIPSHSDKKVIEAFVNLAESMGYEKGRTLYPLLESQHVTIG